MIARYKNIFLKNYAFYWFLMNKEEEIIKKYLHDIATEDYSEVWHEFPVKIPNKPELSHEISDWTSNHRRSLSM